MLNYLFAVFASILCIHNAFSQSLDSVMTVYYQTNEFKLTNNQKQDLNTWSLFFKEKSLKSIEISGFCDDVGSQDYNKKLSENRAREVENWLKANYSDLPETRYEGKGELALKDSLVDTEIERSKNRKVEIMVTWEEEKEEVIIDDAVVKTDFSLDSIQKGDKLLLEDILFYGGRHVILPRSRQPLQEIVTVLLAHPEVKFEIQGHICCTPNGDEGHDFDTGLKNLSVARAFSIYEYFLDMGITEERMTYKGMAGKYPTGKGDMYDRRVEILILSTGEE